MADEGRSGRETKLHSHHGKQRIFWRHEEDRDATSRTLRPSVRNTTDSEETIRPTKPINIPGESGEHAIVEGPGQIDGLTIDTFLRTRQPSISFSTEVKLDSGHHQSMVEHSKNPATRVVVGPWHKRFTMRKPRQQGRIASRKESTLTRRRGDICRNTRVVRYESMHVSAKVDFRYFKQQWILWHENHTANFRIFLL